MNVGDLVKVLGWSRRIGEGMYPRKGWFQPQEQLLGIITGVFLDSDSKLYHYRIHLPDGTWTQEQEDVVEVISESR